MIYKTATHGWPFLFGIGAIKETRGAKLRAFLLLDNLK